MMNKSRTYWGKCCPGCGYSIRGVKCSVCGYKKQQGEWYE